MLSGFIKEQLKSLSLKHVSEHTTRYPRLHARRLLVVIPLWVLFRDFIHLLSASGNIPGTLREHNDISENHTFIRIELAFIYTYRHRPDAGDVGNSSAQICCATDYCGRENAANCIREHRFNPWIRHSFPLDAFSSSSTTSLGQKKGAARRPLPSKRSSQTPTGLAFSGSILYCLIARATSLPVIFPSFASAAIAACAM